ncbi:MAG: LTA synthase family protein [Lachnospiraceae bacterium]
MKGPIQVLNIVFFELVAALLFVCFQQLRIALMAETSFFLIIGLANFFVIQFRSAPIMPWDLLSLGTAVTVADNYSYRLDKNTIFVLLGFLLLLLFESRCRYRMQKNWKIRLMKASVLLLLLWGYVIMLHQDSTVRKFQLYDKLFTPTVMTKRDGTAVAFLMQLEYMSVSKPDGYNSKEAAALLDSYKTSQTVTKTPNIIVIMDEALSDPGILGEISVNEDYLPYIHSLMESGENTTSGNLNVSILGGNTPNTEFEFLTGNTMAFLPQGSIPFQQYIKKELPSMASHLRDIGYDTVAMHPYHAGGWDRDTVYPLLGFNRSYFLDDFTDATLVRNYVSDQSSFDKIIDIYEKKEKKQPLFIFNVTMQNHSSYEDAFDNFKPAITVEGVESQLLSNYLSLMKLTDDAFRNLVQYFEKQEEDTIIVLFGDHQPTNSVVEPVWRLQGKQGSNLTDTEEALRYQVPYMIWSNFDTKEVTARDTSANYLGGAVLETAGLPLPAYFNFLQEESSKFPILSAIQAVTTDGTTTPVKEQADALNQYSKLQYYQLFGTRKK